MTQFGRALKALTIEIICANSSQAKGRVERANKTLKDRLVKELRLAGVSTMEAGMADYNARFATAPFNDKDLHRAMTPRDRLDEAFTWRAERTLSQSLTLQYDNIRFMIDPSEFAQAAVGQRVEVVDFPDGRLEVRFKGKSMPYRTFDRLRRVSETAVLENKRLGGLLALIRENQESAPPSMRTRKGPQAARSSQPHVQRRLSPLRSTAGFRPGSNFHVRPIAALGKTANIVKVFLEDLSATR
jgi:hypothetical protein